MFSSRGVGGENIVIPQGLKEVPELKEGSYLKLWGGGCVREVLTEGRSPGGVPCCPSGGFDEKVRTGCDLPLLCSVCDSDGKDHEKHFGGGGGGDGRGEEVGGGGGEVGEDFGGSDDAEFDDSSESSRNTSMDIGANTTVDSSRKRKKEDTPGRPRGGAVGGGGAVPPQNREDLEGTGTGREREIGGGSYADAVAGISRAGSQASTAPGVLQPPPLRTTGGQGLGFPVSVLNTYVNSSAGRGRGGGGSSGQSGGGSSSGRGGGGGGGGGGGSSGRGGGGGVQRGRGQGRNDPGQRGGGQFRNPTQQNNSSLTKPLRSQDLINATARQVIGNTESTGEIRRFWTDWNLDKKMWRCGEIVKDPRSGYTKIDGEGKEVMRGGCGAVNKNNGPTNFMCGGCGEGKSGWKQDGGASDSNKHSSFSCDCRAYTFHNPSDSTQTCYSCKDARGAWHPIYGFNRGVMKNPTTGVLDVYLGYFGEPGHEEEKWKNENNFKRPKRT